MLEAEKPPVLTETENCSVSAKDPQAVKDSRAASGTGSGSQASDPKASGAPSKGRDEPTGWVNREDLNSWNWNRSSKTGSQASGSHQREAQSDPQDTKASPNPKEDDADARAAALAMFCAPTDQDLMTFGKYKGRTYQSMIDEEVSYVKWVLEHCNEQSGSGMRRFKDWRLAKAAAAAS